MGPFVMRAFVMGPFAMGPYVGVPMIQLRQGRQRGSKRRTWHVVFVVFILSDAWSVASQLTGVYTVTRPNPTWLQHPLQFQQLIPVMKQKIWGGGLPWAANGLPCSMPPNWQNPLPKLSPARNKTIIKKMVILFSKNVFKDNFILSICLRKQAIVRNLWINAENFLPVYV
jgi:hypothetical protein